MRPLMDISADDLPSFFSFFNIFFRYRLHRRY